MHIRSPPPAIVARMGRSNRATATTAALFNDARHLSSTPASRRSSKNDDNNNDSPHHVIDEPWWSLSSLHKKVATIIASSLPEESLSAVHKSLSDRLNETDSHKSMSINEAIVSARAREAHHRQSSQSSLTNNGITNNNGEQKQLEKEIEQRALEKAQERMQLELQAMKEQLKRKDEERIQRLVEEQEKMEKEHQRELAFGIWKENAAKERQQEKEHGNNGLRQSKNEDESMHQNSREATTTSNSFSQEPNHYHPILGPQIAKLPYKRIHLTPAATLASLPVYEKQRAYRHDRAAVMAKDKKKTLWMGIPGVISLMEDDDGRLSILDGQHRVGMMALLQEEQRKMKENEKGVISGQRGISNSKSNKSSSSDTHEELAKLDLNNVLVEVFFPRQSQNNDTDSVLSNSQKQAAQDDKAVIFTEINKAEPIKLLDLPGVANKRTRDIIDHAASHFHDAFPAMFSSSQKCRAPHLNLDNLRDALFASEVIQRETIGSGGELVKWITKKNEELKKNVAGLESDGNNKRGVSESALKKARRHDFYLGLESTWLYK